MHAVCRGTAGHTATVGRVAGIFKPRIQVKTHRSYDLGAPTSSGDSSAQLPESLPAVSVG